MVLMGGAQAQCASAMSQAKFAFVADDTARLQAYMAEQLVAAMPHLPQVQTVRHTLDADGGSAANMLPLMILAQQLSAGGRAPPDALAPSLLWASMLQPQPQPQPQPRSALNAPRSTADAPFAAVTPSS